MVAKKICELPDVPLAEGRALHQEIADLPSIRVQKGVAPFEHCNVDLFGPLGTRFTRNSVKESWGVILGCQVTRAVHIELATTR